MRSIQHILVATDFGPSSQRAIVTAIEMATALRAKVTVVHVLQVSDPLTPLEDLRADASRALESVIVTLRARGLECTGVLRAGECWREIVQFAEETHADLVVVGSHGRRGLALAWLGSVAEKVVRRAPMPVLAVHGFWFEDRAEAGRELAKEFAVLRALKPAVIAISRGGLVVGREVANALGTTFDALLTRPLRYDGKVFGGLCEEGTLRLAPNATALEKLPEEREKLVSSARITLSEEVLELRGGQWIGDLWRRTAILVSDALMDPWSVLAAAAVVRKVGASRIIVAAPVASEDALAALRMEFPDVTTLHSMPADFEPSAAYRNFQDPSMQVLVDAIHCIATTAA